MRIAVFIIALMLLSGCEATKSLLGVSIMDIEYSRPQAVTKVFNYGYDECYKKTEEALKEFGSKIYYQDAGMFACYFSREDTTPVGIYLEEVDSKYTQIEIASPSSHIKNKMSRELFSVLESLAPAK